MSLPENPIDKTPEPLPSAAATEASPSSQQKAELLQGLVEDIKDLQQARKPHAERAAHASFWKRLGPGLITGAADDDPSGIGTYSVAGAQFGYGLLWLVPWCIPLMIAVQEMCGRIGSITGQGLAAVIKAHYARWVLLGSVGLLFGANIINIWADLNVMAASAGMLFPLSRNAALSQTLWLTVTTAIILALLILVPYRLTVRYLKYLTLALLAYVVTAFWPGVHHPWGEIFHALVLPQWRHGTAFLMTVVGFLGTTISPYLFFWQAGQTVEETVAEAKAQEPGKRLRRVSEDEMRMVHADTTIGMIISQGITFFIMICTAGTLHMAGKTDINTAQEAAQALLPLGRAAYVLFTLGILGTGLLAVPTLAGSAAYALAETVGWRYGLYRRFRRARGFYLTIAVVIVLGYALNFVHTISPIKGLLYAAVINGVVAPPLILILLLICNNPKIVGERRNSALSNTLGILALLAMTAAAALMIWGMTTGKMS